MTTPLSPSATPWSQLAEKEGLLPAAQTRLNADGLTLKNLYTKEDLAALEIDQIAGLPPFTRGIRASMYAHKPWTIRQYAGFSTVEETNSFFRSALAAGQHGLSVAFDLATHRGYDSDHPQAAADVGKAGVAVCSVDDMKRLFADIDLGKVSVSMTMNGAVLPIMAAYIVAAEEQGIPMSALSGTLQNDILKEFLVRNTYIYPPDPSMRIATDIIAFCTKNLPKFNPISISGYHMHEAGATTVQELAFTLANGLAYIDAAQNAGLELNEFCPRLSFFFGIGMNFFMEIAKLRAARILWAQLLQQRYRLTEPRALMLRTHCQTSGVSLTEQDPLNNVVRTAYEALAAVLGGTQSLHTNSYDEALALPSDQAARLARNTQLILQEETDITHVVDPLGGSYYIEHLTHSIAAAARDLIAKIESKGGMIEAVKSGWVQTQIETAATIRQARIENGQDTIIGVNKHRLADETTPPARDIDAASVRQQQTERLNHLKAARDATAVTKALSNLKQTADSQGNLLEASIRAIRARATVGEVSAVLEHVFSRHQTSPRILKNIYAKTRAGDAEFQRIQALVSQHSPALVILKLGQDGHDRGAKVVAGAFADLGFQVQLGALFDTPEQAALRVIASGAKIAGLSSLAGAHKELIPAFIQALHAQGGHDVIIVVGGVIPPADYGVLFESGVSAIYGPATDLLLAAEEIINLLTQRNAPPHSRHKNSN